MQSIILMYVFQMSQLSNKLFSVQNSLAVVRSSAFMKGAEYFWNRVVEFWQTQVLQAEINFVVPYCAFGGSHQEKSTSS